MAPADSSNQAKAAIPSPAGELREAKRHGLIAQLLCATRPTKLDSITWAYLWFADLSNLEELVRACEEIRLFTHCMHLGLSKSEDKTQVIDTWAVARTKEELGKASEDEESDTDSEEPPTKKRRLALDQEKRPSVSEEEATHIANKLCTERDNASCVVTGCRDPVEIARILPIGLGMKEAQEPQNFWSQLYRFWSKERVDA